MEKQALLQILGLFIVLFCGLRFGHTATVNFRFLSHEKLQLLNVAVKGRLVSLLSETMNETQVVRNALATYIESCVKVTTKEKECRMCVKERCMTRMEGCRLDVPTLSEMIVGGGTGGLSGTHLMGVEFIGSSPEVTRSINSFAFNARNDILGNVPNNLRETSSQLLSDRQLGFDNTRDKMHMQMNAFQSSINELDMTFANPDVLMNHAVTAAEELAIALNKGRTIQQRLETDARYVMDQMPGMMTNMNQRLRHVEGVFQNAMGMARNRFNSIMGVSDTSFGGPFIPNVPIQGQFAGSTQGNSGSFQGQFPSNGMNGQFNAGFVPWTQRWKRSSEPSCAELRDDPITSCDVYKIQCSDCNLKLDSQTDCNNSTKTAADEIVTLDSETIEFLNYYKEQMKQGLIVLQVEFNDGTDPEVTHETGQFITARIGNDVQRFKSSEHFNPQDMAYNGRIIGDTIWKKLWQNNIFFTHITEVKSTWSSIGRTVGDSSVLSKVTSRVSTQKLATPEVKESIRKFQAPHAIKSKQQLLREMDSKNLKRIIKVDKNEVAKKDMLSWASSGDKAKMMNAKITMALVSSLLLVHNYLV